MIALPFAAMYYGAAIEDVITLDPPGPIHRVCVCSQLRRTGVTPPTSTLSSVLWDQESPIMNLA